MQIPEGIQTVMRQFDDDNLHPDLEWMATEIRSWVTRIVEHFDGTPYADRVNFRAALGHMVEAKQLLVELAEEKDRAERQAARTDVVDVNPASETDEGGS